MENTDITIIGAGVIGLAVAAELEGKGLESVVVERNESFGRETSGRNSEVVHAGIYYPKGSLRARLCVEGRRTIYELCRKHNIPYRKTGKLIVAAHDSHLADLEKLMARGEANGVDGLRLISGSEVLKMEPDVRTEGALFSSETGIFDSQSFMSYLERKARSATFAYNCLLTSLERTGGGYRAGIINSDGRKFAFTSRFVVNAAGLGAEKVAAMAGIDTEKAGYKIYPCKGEYFKLHGEKAKGLRHLIYPPPTKISLGIHTGLDLKGGVRLGPNAFYVDEIEYSVDEGHRGKFYRSVKEYLPFVREDDLSPDISGIRPKLYREGEPVRDFVIREESGRGLPGLINLIGIDSPGLTAAPAIAKEVLEIIAGLNV